MEEQMYERVVFYLENGSYPTGRLTKNSCHTVSTSVRLPILLMMLALVLDARDICCYSEVPEMR